jgi:archaemetzincin
MGSIPTRLGKKLVARVRRRVSPRCVLRDEIPAEQLPVLPDRGQVDADALLRMLEESSTAKGIILVGLTDEDLGTRLFTFIIGQARLGGTAALVSLKRLNPEYYGLRPDPSLILQRAVVEVLHELGHIAGLGHCSDYDCLMNFVAEPESIDVRGASLCPTCAGQASRRSALLNG